MENNNWRPAQGEPPSMEIPSSDWRSQLQPEARQRIVNKIMDTLRRHLPVAAPEGMTELKKIAVRFEEKIYAAAVNQSDYLRKISLKMLSMETKTQQNAPMNSQPGVNQNSTDTGSLAIPPQVNSQGQPLPQIPIVGPSSGRQQLLAQNLQNNTPASMQGSSSLSASPSIAGLTQSTITNFGHTSNVQNMPGISHSSINNSLAQGPTTDIYANAQRHMQGRQQQQSQNPLIYQNQLQPQLMKQKIHNNALLQPSMPQQQQQSLLQTNQLQPSQQSAMQMPSGLTSSQSSIQQPSTTSIQSASQPALQQNQLNSIQQSVSPLLPQHMQAFARQSQQPQSSLHQQTNLQTQQQHQQQQQLIGQQANMPNMSNIQQNQLLGQQNSIVDIKQQQQRLPVQQNNIINMQQSQQLLNQQSLSLHQQQLGQQTNMQGLQQQQQTQSQQQQQQLLGSLHSNMQSHQRSMQLLQQSKNMSQTQQQLQQPSISLLQPQGQQSHHLSSLSSQQHLMSQFQSQGQLQQPLAMQQQSNAMQRVQPSGTLIQPQSAMEQQKQFMQSQRGIPEVSSSTSMDSTAQTAHNGADWQEEIYQKIQAMKEAHFAELQEFHLKISQRYQQSEMMPHARQSGNFEKLKNFKVLLERVLAFLQISKNNIAIGLKEKLPSYEKQIIGLLNSNSKQKMPLPLQGQQQLQHPGGLAQSTPQHQPSQVLQLQQHENLGNQAHQMNMTGSITSMQSAVTSSMQHGSLTLPSLVAPVTQQNATNSVQSAPDLDPVQVNSFGSLQQGTMGSVQQSGVGPLPNSIGAAQQTNLNNLSQSSLSSLQPNGTSVQNSNVLQQQHLKQQQQEHLLQNQQLKQQLQQRQMQQQLLQQQQRQQLQQPLQQQVHLQQKQQQPSQLPVHQMSQLHPMNELNELKARQGSGIKPGIYQQPFTVVQRPNYYHQQLKPGASFPISSPQSLQASSPQISHHSSPQIEHALLPTLAKPGTPMQSTGSPFVVPSPSTPIAPSPIPGDSEKLLSAAVSLPTTGQTTSQQAASAPLQSQSISVATPGISASPLLAEFSSQEGNLTNATSRVSASERPLERLIKAVQSLSPTALSSAVSDISSVVSMIDRIAGSAPGNGSRAAVGEDLVAMTKCRLQARNFMSQDGGATTKKMKRHTSAMPLNNVSAAGSVNDNFMKFDSHDSSELESTATSHVKRRKLEVNHALQEEIREINQQLIDTVVSICDEDSDSAAAVAASEGVGEGSIFECSFNAVAFSPSLKAHFASMHMCPIAPLRLLVPSNYPKCSPLLLDKLPIEPSKEFEDLSMKAKSRFIISLRGLPQPMSLGDMAGTWDACARKVIVEYVQQTGGGSFSSTYGAWKNCVGA